jgi:hypothetical protein
MNILNKGRCSRCIASSLQFVTVVIKRKEEIIAEITKDRKWLYCAVKENVCRYVAMNCKEPSMGISATDYTIKIGEINAGEGEKDKEAIEGERGIDNGKTD